MSKTISALLAACALALPTAALVAPAQANAAPACGVDACPIYLPSLGLFWFKR